jgi:hypothetical protein
MPRAMPAPATQRAATLLLPPRAAFAGQDLPRDLALALGRAGASQEDPGDQAQLQRHFTLVARGWPVAALTRSVDSADAAGPQWLRADPAWIRPDINGARLFAAGEGLRLDQADVDALLPGLRALFGDAGMPIDAPHPSRWYLRIAPGLPLPAFTAPADALGADLGDALVDDALGPAADMRRWRMLLSEAQVVLHNHPWNAKRAAEGKPPVNSLWFWGGGALPAAVQCIADEVRSEDVLVRALARRAGRAVGELPAHFDAGPGNQVLFDLRASRDLPRLAADWLQPAFQALRGGAPRDRLREVRLDFGDGATFVVAATQRWRVWRRPLARLA